MLVIKYPDSTGFSVNNVETAGRILDEVKVKVDNSNKRILVNAFYYKQKRGNIEGLYSVLWDTGRNRKIKEFASVFNDELRNSAKSSDGSTKMAFNDYFIKNIILRKDGGIPAYQRARSTPLPGAGALTRWDYSGRGNPWSNPMDYTYWSPYGAMNSPWNRWNTNSVTRYHAENIMILSYNSEGGVEWSNVIPKSQFDDESDNMVSYQLMNMGADIHFPFQRV